MVAINIIYIITYLLLIAYLNFLFFFALFAVSLGLNKLRKDFLEDLRRKSISKATHADTQAQQASTPFSSKLNQPLFSLSSATDAPAFPASTTLSTSLHMNASSLSPRIIFLDVDGVLCLSRSLQCDYHAEDATLLHPSDSSLFPIERACLQNLIQLVSRTEASIVVSSSWRTSETNLAWLTVALREAGLPEHSVIRTTPLLSGQSRGAEILAWLRDNNHAEYVIFEDSPAHLASFVECNLSAHVVQTKLSTYGQKIDAALEGLTSTCAAAAEQILRTPCGLACCSSQPSALNARESGFKCQTNTDGHSTVTKSGVVVPSLDGASVGSDSSVPVSPDFACSATMSSSKVEGQTLTEEFIRESFMQVIGDWLQLECYLLKI